jgi:hypothetical protein
MFLKRTNMSCLSSVIKAVATGDIGRRFDLAKQFHKTILTPALKAKGVPDEWIANVAKFEWQHRRHIPMVNGRHW